MSYVKIENGVVIQKQPYPEDGFIEVHDSVICGMTYDGENFTNPVAEFSLEGLKQYRDSYIEQEITFGDITVTNTQNTRTSLSAILQSWMTDKTISTIKFKHNDGIEDAGFDDLQAVLKACFAREQVGRSAEAVVLSNHANTPYTTMQDAYDDFDEEVS